MTRVIKGILYGWTEEDYNKRIYQLKRIGKLQNRRHKK